MKKLVVLIGILASFNAFAKMKVESFGDSYFSIRGNGSFIYLKNKEQSIAKENYLTMNLLNKNLYKDVEFSDNDKEFELIPHLGYINIAGKIDNYNAGFNFMKHYYDSIFGVNIDLLKSKYKENDIKGNKGQLNLFYSFKNEDGEFIISPYYYKNSMKIKDKKYSEEYIGGFAKITSNLTIIDLDGLKYEVGVNAYSQLKNKNKEKNEVVNGNFGIKYETEIETDNLIIKPKIESKYVYNFKDNLKQENFKDKMVVGVGVNIERNETLNLFLENEFKKSLNNKNIENISTLGIIYKF